MILIIAGPLLLFSSFNPLATDNLVTGSSIQVLLVANLTLEGATNQYELFKTTRFTDISLISDSNYKSISAERVVRNLERNLFQQVELSRVSDNSWTISPPVQTEIFDLLSESEVDQDLGINVVLVYNFVRPEPAGQLVANKELPIINILDSKLSYGAQVRSALLRALDPNRACDPKEDIS